MGEVIWSFSSSSENGLNDVRLVMSSVVLVLLLGLSWGLPSGPVTGEETWGFSMMMAGIKRRADERSYERIGAEATCASDLRMSLSLFFLTSPSTKPAFSGHFSCHSAASAQHLPEDAQNTFVFPLHWVFRSMVHHLLLARSHSRLCSTSPQHHARLTAYPSSNHL